MNRPIRCLLAIALIAAASACAAAVPIYHYRVVRSYPHDPKAFTEGLFYQDGYLYESTGEPGESYVRKVDLASGKVLQQDALPAQYFGEGIVGWKDRLIELTWRSGIGVVRDLASFKIQHSFHYAGEGWALTHDGQHLYMSDGTPNIRVLDPETLQQVGSIAVTADGQPVQDLNELEWVKGELYANIWKTERIARINPASGKVVGWIDLKGLFDYAKLDDPEDDVLNGIAYDATHDRLFVTGKRWPRLFEITLLEPAKQNSGR